MLTSAPTLTPLEPWIAEKIGLPPGARPSAEAIGAYQLRRLRETIGYVRERSPFYRERLADVDPDGLRSLADVARLPFTTAADLLGNSTGLLCVPQREIERVVTLSSSGTTSEAKRVYFTAEDLELTVDFFHHGMSALVGSGQRVLVLMPGEAIGSVGDLLRKGLARLGAEGIVHGIVRDPLAVIAEIREREIDCLVGLPVQVLGLARHPASAAVPEGRIKSVLLSADYVPSAIVREIERAWGVPVFNHYGMTEMGLGGAVDCRATCGYHLREADLYVEIVDPATGLPLPDGEAGEVVFTTLTRRGMPLVRYRTGDLSRFIPESCPCGSSLKRLEWVRGRLGNRVTLVDGGVLGMADLDEVLFPLPGLLDFRAELVREHGWDTLRVTLFGQLGDASAEDELAASARDVLGGLPALASAASVGGLAIDVVAASEPHPATNGSIKRTLCDLRGK
ncbi:MAG: DVU_1553 family AMP-dependent CoA ligase [Coriobacteriia bacterium]